MAQFHCGRCGQSTHHRQFLQTLVLGRWISDGGVLAVLGAFILTFPEAREVSKCTKCGDVKEVYDGGSIDANSFYRRSVAVLEEGEMAKHVAKKVEAGHYIYRNHNIYHETDAEGPCGTEKPYWSISGEIGGPDEHSAHALLPQLQRLTDCKDWLDAHLDGPVKKKHDIERERFRTFRSDKEETW